jgi:hypothetical protein
MGSQLQKAIASTRLSFMEKYGFAYPEDIELVRGQLDAEITYSEDKKTARVKCGILEFDVKIRDMDDKKGEMTGKWIIS